MKPKKSRKNRMVGALTFFTVCLLFVWLVLYNNKNNNVKAKVPSKNTEYLNSLLRAYPTFLDKIEGNNLIWSDGTVMPLFDSIENKSQIELLENPSLSDQFKYYYSLEDTKDSIPFSYDPGRIRHLPFFKKMYGNTKDEIEKNLTEIIWLPKSLNHKLTVTKINEVDKKLEQISNELDTMPHLLKYLKNPGGTFAYRKISGTDRLSPHSFGMTIDINVEFSNYWQWDCKCTDENIKLNYKNRIPMEIVRVFEKYGFIWGGRWYHYDTMHFEYRPEFFESTNI